MKRPYRYLAVALLGILGACSSAQNTAVNNAVNTAVANLAQDANTAQQTVNTLTPVVNKAMCDVQAAANTAGDIAAKTGNPDQAKQASNISTVAGAMCLTSAPATK